MTALMSFARGIDRVTTFIGRGVAWLVLVVVLVSAGNAVIRKIFDMSSNAWLELQWYLFGAIFMLAAAWTLQRNEHIRVDIVSNALSKRTRDWIDFLGHIFFLLPFCGLMTWLLVPYVIQSVSRQEYSPNAGGLIVWPAKALLLAGFLLLLAQAISELIKRTGVLFFGMEDKTPMATSHAEAAELSTLEPNEPEGGADAPDHTRTPARDAGAAR
ncbi:TRAP transporter small permease subunit [Aurantimonas sp. VKM B-3413]|uniref:TRAP transporter small permease subunit n=1 Tax=Aurantimonas sp. VKM B-3413 TaxID=2779401 RepID=UPI001E4710D2|nr:TRAP transporter small permease subunit [Aurantimonas sp. VKM B-3413]MCB8840056.1 TRAP transporter small permease subunit [Aurantimonas sp. VKM B-3413]